MSKCPDCNAEIYGSTYCVFCDWGKSAGISRLDALRAENAALKERVKAQRAVIEKLAQLFEVAQDAVNIQTEMLPVHPLPMQIQEELNSAHSELMIARAGLRELEGEKEYSV